MTAQEAHKLSRTEEIDSMCQRSIEAILPLFIPDLGHVSIPPDTTLWTLITTTTKKTTPIFSLPDPTSLLLQPTTLTQILKSTVPASELAFFAPTSNTTNSILSHLADGEKALLLAQAICAIIVIFTRLADAAKPITPALLSRELQLFTEGDQLRTLIERLEKCCVWNKCYMKTQIEDAMMDAIQAARRGDGCDVPDVVVGVDGVYGIRGWEVPMRNMGLPWGFSIMAIN